MKFEIIDEIEGIETVAVGSKIRDLADLQKMHGRGRWRKLKGNWNWRTFTQTDLNNGIVPLRIQFSPSPTRYNRNNWVFEFRGDSWSELTQDFIQSLGPTYISRGYNVLSYQFSYLNVRDIDSIANPNTGFFASSNNYDIHDLEAYWAQHPDKTFILWTSSLARAIGTQVSQDFNSGMRAYAQQHNM